MKQLTDEVFAQVRDALASARVYMNHVAVANWQTPAVICSEALAALDTAQPVRVNAMLVEALDAALVHVAHMGHGTPQHMCPKGVTLFDADGVEVKLPDGRVVHAGRTPEYLSNKALTAAKQAQPEPSEMTEEREAYIAGLESRTHEMRKKIEQLDYELRVARSSQERATYTPPKIVDPDAPHPCFN